MGPWAGPAGLILGLSMAGLRELVACEGWGTLRPYSSLSGAGAYSPGLTWGRGALGGAGQGQSGPAVP